MPSGTEPRCYVPRPSGKIRASLFDLASSTTNQQPSWQSPSLHNARRLEVSGGWSTNIRL
jgi:hypothetical protein